jgi:hypothetical protein
MKNLIVLFLLSFVGYSCHFNHPEGNLKQIQLGKIEFDNKTDSIIRLMIANYHCDSCTYELFVDKKDPFEYKLTIRSIESTDDFYRKNHPINYAFIDKNLILIFSGIEDFIDKEKYFPELRIQQNTEYEKVANSWSYVILKDTCYMTENADPEGIPFINARQGSTMIFEAPK